MDQLTYDLLIILLILLIYLIVINSFILFLYEFHLFSLEYLYVSSRVVISLILFDLVSSLFCICLRIGVLVSVLGVRGGWCLICSICRFLVNLSYTAAYPTSSVNPPSD